MILTTCLLLKTTLPCSGFIPVRVERWSLQQEKVLFKDLNHITSGDSHRSVTNYQRNFTLPDMTPQSCRILPSQISVQQYIGNPMCISRRKVRLLLSST